ncbi:sodium/potassium-transporting ATPase subunit beta-1 isoform X2 [Orussus abietinus]|uniref:sodium/potassium-transporting ATPase subunit beta-1 isoform X2 n=1 Tax=Orussus abietinus TaxID=222816 RepID=UPI000C715CD0|nr:sodium/potassium-transporting ATPase subunit beta-1 isoform X2 [Orussus abietinus]
MWAIKMCVTLLYLSPLDKPYVQYYGMSAGVLKSFPIITSAGRSSPGLGFQPNVLTPTTSPIIWISTSKGKGNPELYIQRLDNVLKDYNKNVSQYSSNCVEGESRKIIDEKACFFDTKKLGVCGKSPYGYDSPYHPCIFLRYNKVFEWIPQYYNQNSSLPPDMPHDLQRLIKSVKKVNIIFIQLDKNRESAKILPVYSCINFEQGYLWISCTGAHGFDNDNLGEIEYLPYPGFSVDYFPFRGQIGYLTPIVALHFKNITANKLVTVECTAWAKNIDSSKENALDFQIIVEKSEIKGV